MKKATNTKLNRKAPISSTPGKESHPQKKSRSTVAPQASAIIIVGGPAPGSSSDRSIVFSSMPQRKQMEPLVKMEDKVEVKKEEMIDLSEIPALPTGSGSASKVGEVDDFDYTRMSKSMKRPIKELEELQDKGNSLITRARRDELILTVVRALLNWIPTVHSVALQVDEDFAASTGKAHECLLFSANTLMRIDKIGDLEDLTYHRDVQLRSDKNVVIHSWRGVSGYDPFRILLWVWRDICLSILTKEDSFENILGSASVVISDMLKEIRGCIPLDSYYDHRKKTYKPSSLWDLFLKGGFEQKQLLSQDPTYWSIGFAYSKKRLEQLYISCRFNELQNHPSYELYVATKRLLPERSKGQVLAVVENIRHSLPTLNGRIDIFTYERCTESLEKLIDDGLLKRDTVRFRQIIVPLGRDKSPAVAKWAFNQVVRGFDEAASKFRLDILKVFPYLDKAVQNESGKAMNNLDGFLFNARELKDKDTEAKDFNVSGSRGVAVQWVYVFRGYHDLARGWTSQEALRGKIKDIFVARLGFLLDKFIGKALKKGCEKYDEQDLAICIEYLIGDLGLGFEEILDFKAPEPKKPRRGVAVATVRKKRVIVQDISVSDLD